MDYRFSDKLAALKPSAIREIFKSLTDPEIIAFAAGNPAPESFPIPEMAEISADIYKTMAVKAFQYGMIFSSRISSISSCRPLSGI